MAKKEKKQKEKKEKKKEKKEGKRSCKQTCSAYLLLLCNLSMIAAGAALLGFAVKALMSGFQFGAWFLCACAMTAVLCLFGGYGVYARTRASLKIYFVMLVVLFVLLLWVGIYFLFDRQNVVNAMKASLVNHWPTFYAELPAATASALPDCTATWSDACWTEFEAYIMQSWAAAGFIVLGVVALLPVCMCLAGATLGLMTAVEMVEESMAYVMMLLRCARRHDLCAADS